MTDVSLWSHLVLAFLPQFISKRDPEDVKEVRLLGRRGLIPPFPPVPDLQTAKKQQLVTLCGDQPPLDPGPGRGWGRPPPRCWPCHVPVPRRWWSGSGTATSAGCTETWPSRTATSSAAWRSSLPSRGPRCLVSGCRHSGRGWGKRWAQGPLLVGLERQGLTLPAEKTFQRLRASELASWYRWRLGGSEELRPDCIRGFNIPVLISTFFKMRQLRLRETKGWVCT